MAIEQDIYSVLSSDDGVSALVSSRIKPHALSKSDVLPAIVYQRISTPRELPITGETGFTHPRFQLTCWASTYAVVRALADVVRSALHGKRGSFGNSTIQGCFVIDEGDMAELAPDSDEERSFGIRLDIEIFYNEDS
jgi:hypothetical protein